MGHKGSATNNTRGDYGARSYVQDRDANLTRPMWFYTSLIPRNQDTLVDILNDVKIIGNTGHSNPLSRRSVHTTTWFGFSNPSSRVSLNASTIILILWGVSVNLPKSTYQARLITGLHRQCTDKLSYFLRWSAMVLMCDLHLSMRSPLLAAYWLTS